MKLVAIGDSYTINGSWPDLLAEKLDMECINFGGDGSGNQFIISKVLDTLLLEDVGLVVVQWSEWQRLDFEHHPKRNKGWTSLHPHRDNSRVEKYPMSLEGRWTMMEYSNFVASTMLSLRLFVIAQKLLKDIPHLMMQGPYPLIQPQYDMGRAESYKWNYSEEMKKVYSNCLDHKLMNQIEEDTFIGWPIIGMGGYSMDGLLDENDSTRQKYRQGNNNSTPNDAGNEMISKDIYKVYKKVYG